MTHYVIIATKLLGECSESRRSLVGTYVIIATKLLGECLESIGDRSKVGTMPKN